MGYVAFYVSNVNSGEFSNDASYTAPAQGYPQSGNFPLTASPNAGTIFHSATFDINFSGGIVTFTMIDGTTRNYSGFGNNDLYLVFGVDEATERGSIRALIFVNGSFYLIGAGLTTDLIDSNLAYRTLKANPLITYNWKSLSAISGNGTSLALSQIKNEYLGDGSPVNLAPDTYIDRITNASNLANMLLNIGDTPVPIVYCGDNYLTVQAVFDNDYFQYHEFAFVIAGGLTPIYTFRTVAESVEAESWLQIIYDDEIGAARVSVIQQLTSNPDTYKFNQQEFSTVQEEMLYIWLQGNTGESGEDPYGGGSDDDGGDNFGLTPEDPLPFPSMPTASGLATGLFTVYNPTDTELQYLSDFLWDPDAVGVLEKLFTEPENAIIAFYMLPVAPDHTGNKQLKLAKANVPNCTGVKYLTDGSDGSGRYKEINFGSFSLKPKFDSYLDFNPYTTLKIYLPYIGVQNLNVDEFMCPAQASGAIGKTGYNNTFTLKYRIDLVTGVVSAFILRNNNIRYQFTGKCGMTLPITGRNYDNAISGILTAVAGVATTVASGGATAPMVAGASATAAGTISAMKERVYHSGNLSGEASIFAYDTPYLIITRPNIPESTKDTKKFVGLPSYKTQNTLSNFSGFTKVFDAHIDNVSCTDEEKNEILQLLKEGVII